MDSKFLFLPWARIYVHTCMFNSLITTTISGGDGGVMASGSLVQETLLSRNHTAYTTKLVYKLCLVSKSKSTQASLAMTACNKNMTYCT